jgi:hypothetical protein
MRIKDARRNVLDRGPNRWIFCSLPGYKGLPVRGTERVRVVKGRAVTAAGNRRRSAARRFQAALAGLVLMPAPGSITLLEAVLP